MHTAYIYVLIGACSITDNWNTRAKQTSLSTETVMNLIVNLWSIK